MEGERRERSKKRVEGEREETKEGGKGRGVLRDFKMTRVSFPAVETGMVRLLELGWAGEIEWMEWCHSHGLC